MLIINATPADSLNLSQVIIFFSLSSFEAAPRSPCIPKQRISLPHLVTVPHHSARSAIGALDARICFFFSRSRQHKEYTSSVP